MTKTTAHEEYVKDFDSKKIIGILRYKTNGDIEAIEFNTRKILGYYRANRDETTDFYSRPVSRGNTVVSFIYDAYAKIKSKYGK